MNTPEYARLVVQTGPDDMTNRELRALHAMYVHLGYYPVEFALALRIDVRVIDSYLSLAPLQRARKEFARRRQARLQVLYEAGRISDVQYGRALHELGARNALWAAKPGSQRQHSADIVRARRIGHICHMLGLWPGAIERPQGQHAVGQLYRTRQFVRHSPSTTLVRMRRRVKRAA